jgi:hypothetical protein
VPIRAGPERHMTLRDLLEDLLFRRPDIDALSRGWEVHRPTAFRRVYRDPRWHTINTCVECRGTGRTGAHPCPNCAGWGTVRSTDVATVAR